MISRMERLYTWAVNLARGAAVSSTWRELQPGFGSLEVRGFSIETL
jgi:hypothetical protein